MSLIELIEEGDLEKIKQMNLNKEDILKSDKYGKTGLFYANLLNDHELFIYLIEKSDLGKSDILNCDSNDHLFFAGLYGSYEIVVHLVEKYNLNKDDMMKQTKSGNTALFWACFNGHYNIVKYLIEKGNITKSDATGTDGYCTFYLAGATCSDSYEMVKYLIEKWNLNANDCLRSLKFAETTQIKQLLLREILIN